MHTFSMRSVCSARSEAAPAPRNRDTEQPQHRQKALKWHQADGEQRLSQDYNQALHNHIYTHSAWRGTCWQFPEFQFGRRSFVSDLLSPMLWLCLPCWHVFDPSHSLPFQLQMRKAKVAMLLFSLFCFWLTVLSSDPGFSFCLHCSHKTNLASLDG